MRAYGACQDEKTFRLADDGITSRPAFMARNCMRSRVDHSHSRFWSRAKGPSRPKVSLLTVVSIWKIFTPASRMTLPIRQLEACSAEFSWSINDRDSCMVWTLWW